MSERQRVSEAGTVTGRTKRLWSVLYPWLMLAPATLVVGLFFLLPMLYMVNGSVRAETPAGTGSSFTPAAYREVLTSTYYLHTFAATIGTGLLVTLITILLGFPLASWYSRAKGGKRVALLMLIASPLLVNMVVRTYGWLLLLDQGGLINTLLRMSGLIEAPLKLVYNSTGVVIGMTHVFLPFMVLSIASSLESIDPRLYESAQLLGATPTQQFTTVTVPLSRPGILAGSVMVFSLTQGAFVTPLVLGGTAVRLATVLVYTDTLVLFKWARGTAVAMVLLMLMLVLLYIQRRVFGREGGGYAA